MKTYKPVTPSLRHRRITERKHLSKEKSIKGLTIGFGKSGFRNQYGRVTIRHRGGGHKYNSRILFNNLLPNIGQYIIERLEYDPQRNARIALLKSLSPLPKLLKNTSDSVLINNHKFIYVIAEISWKPGDIINNITTSLKNIPEGTKIYNINHKYIKSAGNYGTLLFKNENYALVRLPSKEVKKFDSNNIAMQGIINNIEHSQTILGKAGASRWIGRRPIVRGEVMNPIDHPHGGKTRGGRPIKNIWGKLAKWVPTANSS